MKTNYLVTFDLGNGELAQEMVVADAVMAGAQNGVLVLLDYGEQTDPQVPPAPVMRRMYAAGVWRTVDNEGPYLKLEGSNGQG